MKKTAAQMLAYKASETDVLMAALVPSMAAVHLSMTCLGHMHGCLLQAVTDTQAQQLSMSE